MRYALPVLLFVAFLDAGNAGAQSRSRWVLVEGGDPRISLDTTTILIKSRDTAGVPSLQDQLRALAASKIDSFVGLANPEPLVWLRLEYKLSRTEDGKKIVRKLWHIYIRCRDRKFDMIEMIHYTPSGEVAYSYTDPGGSGDARGWSDPVPDSIVEAAVNGFCRSRFSR